jgi:RHS repeat-associated protein
MKRILIIIVITLFVLIANVYGQDIYSAAPVILPVSPQTSYTTALGTTTNIISKQSVILNPGTTLSSGSTVIITVDPSLIPPPPSNPASDYDKNWILTRTYDESGNETSVAKAFFDNAGKTLQTQVKNESTGHVLASQPLYDLQGRAVGNTLSAPTNNSAFAYKDKFVTKNNIAYSYLNFDGDPASTSNPYAKINNPDPVDNSQQGTLGWYYSNNNTFEPYVATTAYPYARTEFYRDGTGAVKQSANIGEQLKMGMGHETTSNSFPVQHELDNYLAIRNKFFPLPVSGATPVTMSGQALQSISINEDGHQVVSITDLGGKSLVQGMADPQGWLSVTNTVNLSNIQTQYAFSISIVGPAAIQGNPNDPAVIAMLRTAIRSFSVSSVYPITVTCTSGGVATWTGKGNDYSPPTPPFTGSYSFLITSAYPFYISASNSYGTIWDQAPARIKEPDKSSLTYFQLTSPSSVAVTGNVVVYEMKNETQLSSFASGNTLPAGYYKVVATAPTDNTTNNVTVTYINKYSDITYNYYNQLGQLIGSIAPNGVQKLIQGGYNSYTIAADLPFVSLYEYDLQGRLTAVTTTDGGRSEYVYRQDGKIRFSQNAAQKASANAGTGNIEKFSYINYDTFGRPIESGEYVVPMGAALTFVSTKTNTTLQEKTGADDGLTGGAKQSQVNTYYDLPAANLAPSGYTQDPGFLKGAISYTTNANSTTWYNYDDHGRITWAVKQLAGLTGYKTVNYTYNEQGSASIVEYQKETASERFIHYYTHDADGRLINVKTSSDGGTTKLQQAAYHYYLHGPLKRVELADNLQGIDYTYTPQGWLKTINTPANVPTNDPGKDGTNSFAADAFGMQVEYFPNDYSRAGSNITSVPTGQQTYYNGNVNGISWQSNKPSIAPGLQDPTMYTYGYDNKYQLTTATWGTPNFTTPAFTPGTMFKESGISYDANGNINGLQRTNNTGALGDDFSKYTYQANTNKLTTVGNTDGTNNYATYIYDELGQLKTQTQTQPDGSKVTTYLKYDVAGKITGVYNDEGLTIPKVTYTYDESGNRIKAVNQNGTTYYVYDASGSVMAIYTGTTPTITELPVYGADRLGTYFVAGNNYYYELKDNVGSVKVVINRNKVNGLADIINYTDYYPYGSVARTAGIKYRYEYQGAYAEKDGATGYNNFDLRMYDGRIGRWLSIDPAGQYASPYEGMGNNPVSSSDPTGGETNWHYDKNWHLVADPGDNANTLATFLNIDAERATSMMQNISNWNGGALINSGIPSLSAEGWDPRLNGNLYLNNNIPEVQTQIRYLQSPQAFQDGIRANQRGLDMATGVAHGAIMVMSGGLASGEIGGNYLIRGVGRRADFMENLAAKEGMTDLQLLTRAAQKAENAIGGTGRFAGTAKHTYANNLLNRYQSIYGNRGLQFNQYFNGSAGKGFLDVVNHQTMTIFDYKFGSAVMSSSQFLKYSNSFPGYAIQIIRP